jgi:hypothetical protein
MAADVEDQTVTCAHHSPFFAPAVLCHILIFIMKSMRSSYSANLYQHIDVLSEYITRKKTDREKCVDLTMDRARTLRGKMKGLSALIQAIAPLVV